MHNAVGRRNTGIIFTCIFLKFIFGGWDGRLISNAETFAKEDTARIERDLESALLSGLNYKQFNGIENLSVSVDSCEISIEVKYRSICSNWRQNYKKTKSIYLDDISTVRLGSGEKSEYIYLNFKYNKKINRRQISRNASERNFPYHGGKLGNRNPENNSYYLDEIGHYLDRELSKRGDRTRNFIYTCSGYYSVLSENSAVSLPVYPEISGYVHGIISEYHKQCN
ncbi:MAG: hypothetical protein ABJV04_16230 [Aliiglaciecola sp.]|uniref:hypothetical protein n=1 Tax=Aliiglaciecola sp. TaxID=1872441 RepID=UPI0032970ED5